MRITTSYTYDLLHFSNTINHEVCFRLRTPPEDTELSCPMEARFIHDVEGLFRFCRSAKENEGRALPFEEGGVKIRCTSPIPTASVLDDVEVTIGCAVLTFDSLVSADLLDSLIRCCLLILDEEITRHSSLTVNYTSPI